MSEGPEVHRLARKLHDEFAGSRIVSVESRLKKTRAWLEAHPGVVQGREIERVLAAGKNLLWLLDGGLYFQMHLLMYGKIKTNAPTHRIEHNRTTRGLIVSTSRQAELVNDTFPLGDGAMWQASYRANQHLFRTVDGNKKSGSTLHAPVMSEYLRMIQSARRSRSPQSKFSTAFSSRYRWRSALAARPGRSPTPS